MKVVEADDLASAWANAVLLLDALPGREVWDLVVSIRDPASEEPRTRRTIDRELAMQGLQSVETVASTIFPQALWSTCRDDSDRLYTRYRRMLPKLRRFPGNRNGLYFERLIRWPSERGNAYNQLDAVVKRLRRERTRGHALRFVYDLTTFSPARDPRPMGFPCLAYINVKLAGDRLLMTAHYRNHYFVERAFGNYVGLARLQSFIAARAGIDPAGLVCISGHAELDHSFERLVAKLRKIHGP